MALYGSAVPLNVDPAEKPVAVLVICPNAYSHQRLMSALNDIVPEAGRPVPIDDGDGNTAAPPHADYGNPRAPLPDPEREDDTGDEYPDPRYAGASCNIGGRCDD